MSCAGKLRNGADCPSAAVVDGLCSTHFLVVRENGRRAERGERPMSRDERQAFLKAEKLKNQAGGVEPLRTR